jgi:general secretion pathway protein J
MRQRGFTLIEIIVALFISAVMLAIGYAAIERALRDRDGITTAQTRVTEIQRGMRIIAQDFAQIIARPARDLSGTGDLAPAVVATGTDTTLITFTRAGWSNPAGIQRPAEQRVMYAFVEGQLVRDYWLSVDPALNAEPRERVIFTNVKSVEIRFLDPVGRNWRTQWPAIISNNGPMTAGSIDLTLRPRPLAIELTIEFEDWGRIVRTFEIPT